MPDFIQFQKTTKWRNPTKDDVRFSIFVQPGEKHAVKIPAGSVMELPSIYDAAVQTVRDGVIVGGLAPQLVAEGRATVPIHEALARAAALGETERKLMASTGVSGGSVGLDVAVALQARIAELEARLAAGDTASAPTPSPAPKGR